MKKILPFFSYAFHPIFISVFAVVFFFFTTTGYFNYETIYLYVIQTLIITVFIPLAIFYLLITLNKIDSIMVTDVSQRKIPLIIQSALFGTLLFKSFTMEVSPELYYFFLGSMISSFIALLLVYFKKKASLHMLGMASFTVFCIGCMMHFGIKNSYFVSGLFLCNGLVGTSRFEMKAHTLTELTVGYAIGLIPQLVLLFFWL